MKNERLQNIFFFALLISGIGLLLSLAYPFLGALTIAVTLAVSFRTTFRKILKKLSGRRNLAAWATILLIIFIVIIPLSLIGTKIFREISDLYLNYATGQDGEGVLSKLSLSANSWLGNYFPGINFDLQSYVSKGIEWMFLNLNDIFSSALKLVFNLFIIFVTLFFLFKDGNKLRRTLLHLSPLDEKETATIANQLELTINSVVKGTVIIAIIQGLLAGIGFSIFDVTEPVLWGVLTTIASILPGFGTGLIFLPIIIYLITIGSYTNAIGLTIWGVVVVGLIDNFLRPILLERDIKIHPLMIFLSVLGGLSMFGTLGFILGPLILSATFSLSRIYQEKNSDV